MEGASDRRVRPRRAAAGGIPEELGAAAGGIPEELGAAAGGIPEALGAAAGDAADDGAADDDAADALDAAAADKLHEDLHDQFLLRLPPQRPELLFRFVLVSKAWRRILTDVFFVQRYREYHAATPQMLGCVFNEQWEGKNAEFISTVAAPFAPRLPNNGIDLNIIDSRHGRMLFWNRRPPGSIVVWHPFAGFSCTVSLPEAFASAGVPRYVPRSEPFPEASCRAWWSAAIVCDAAPTCLHTKCHAGPYRIVFIGMNRDGKDLETSVFVYRSTTNSWAPGTSTRNPTFAVGGTIQQRATTVVDNYLFFRTCTRVLLRYQLSGKGEGNLCFIRQPAVCSMHARGTALVPAAGGKVKFVVFQENLQEIQVWETEADTEVPAHWTWLNPVKVRVPSRMILGFAEASGAILLGIDGGDGPIVMDLSTGRYESMMGKYTCGGASNKFDASTAERRYRESTNTTIIPLMFWFTPCLFA